MHLNDVPYLETSPLTSLISDIPGGAALSAASRGAALQQLLLRAIESLRPEPDWPSQAATAAQRRHRLLYLRYAEMLDIQEICAQLLISQRKYYVEHVIGVKAVISFVTNPAYLQDFAREKAPAGRADRSPGLDRHAPTDAASAHPFTARTNELALLTSLCEVSISEGRSRLVLVDGDAGVGKSRLARTFARYARARGAAVIEARYNGAADPPYAPWRDMVKAGLQLLPQTRRAAYLRELAGDLPWLLPESSRGRPGTRRTRPVAGEIGRSGIYASIAQALEQVAAQAPLVVLLDDLSRAPGLGMLAYLATHPLSCSLMLLATYRGDELLKQQTLVRDLRIASASAAVTRVSLSAFTLSETTQMLASVFGERTGTTLGRAVYETTRGNPFFIEETMRSLVDRRIVWATPSGWECSDSTSMAVPESVLLSIEERMARMDPIARRLLEQAAVLGPEFETDTLAALTYLDRDSVYTELEKVVSAGILLDRSTLEGDRYAFVDTQLQEVIYAGLPEEQRRSFHVAAARAMEERCGDDRNDRASEIADHLAHSADQSDLGDALQYLRQASENAARMYAYSSAVKCLSRALEVETQLAPDDRRRCDLLLALADVLGPEGDSYHQGQTVAEEALDLAERVGDESRARQACQAGLEAVFRSGGWMAATTAPYRDWVDRSNRHAAIGTFERIRCDAAAAWVKWSKGEWAEAGADLADLWAQAQASGDAGTQFEVAAIALSLQPSTTDFAWHQQVAEAVIHLPRQGVRLRPLATALRHAGATLLQAGDRATALPLWAELRSATAHTRDAYLSLYPLTQQSVFALLDGDLAGAVETARQLGTRADRSGMSAVGRLMSANLSVRPLLLLGAAGEALPFLEHHTQPTYAGPDDPTLRLPLYQVLCLIQLERRDEAVHLLDDLVSRIGPISPRRAIPAPTVALMVEAALRLDDLRRLAILVPVLAKVQASHLAAAGFTSTARLLAEGFAMLGDAARAREAYEKALAQSTALGHRPELALIHLGLGTLLSDEHPREELRAKKHLELAFSELRALRVAVSAKSGIKAAIFEQ